MSSRILPSTLLALGLLATPAQAQVTADGTVETVVTPAGTTFTITGGTTAGTNLFHSFDHFSVPTGGEAFFNNATNIANIFSRVTGGSTSNIDGILSANGTANLFLLNPNGIIFGANSSLQIGGSFLATTAESFVFEDGNLFSATNRNTSPLLTVSVPIGLQMGSNPGDLLIQGTNQNTGSGFTNLNSGGGLGLQVQPGQTLAFLGGNILIEGKDLIASSGRIELGSVTANSLVQLLSSTEGWMLDYQGADAFQDITLTQAALIDTSGDNGGNIQIQGRRIKVSEGTTVSGRTRGVGNGGILFVRASELLEVTGGENATRFSVSLAPGSRGQGGNIAIETGQLRLVEGGQIGAGTLGSGDTGNITVRANSIDIIGTESSGDFPSGIFVTVQAIGTGNGGNLIIDTEYLKIADGGIIAAFTLGGGNAGNITIQANEIDISGTSSVFENSKIDAFSVTEFAAGSININTNRLSIRNDAEITVSSSGLGDAGNININARNIFLDRRGRLRAEVNGGSQGNINLDVRESLLLRRGSSISTNATGASTGGNININAGFIAAVPTENSDISANSNSSFGGRVSITTNGIFGMQFRPQLTPLSDITASSGLGAAFSGTVDINQLTTDPSNGLIELSAALTDASNKVVSGCAAALGENSFIVTGRGGLPPNPSLQLESDRPWSDLRDLSAFRENGDATVARSQVPEQIVEANSWRVSESGTIELIATIPSRSTLTHALNCAAIPAKT